MNNSILARVLATTEDTTLHTADAYTTNPRGYYVGGICPSLTVNAAQDIAITEAALCLWLDEFSDWGAGYVGRWTDTDTGLAHFDFSTHYDILHRALSVAKSREQIAIWDNGNDAEIRL